MSRKRERQPSAKWMTLQQVADHYQVSDTTIRVGRGKYATLRRVPGKPILIPREDVEKLDRQMERDAKSLAA